MEFGSEQNTLDSPGPSSNGSFKKLTSGFLRNDLDLSPGQSLNGSFRKSESVFSAHSATGVSVSSTFNPSSRRVYKGLKEYKRKLVDVELFTEILEGWVVENLCADAAFGDETFRSPFLMDELYKLDFALEGVLLQQLCRMPSSTYASNEPEDDQYLALEDFLHAVVNGLWRTFWHKNGPLPFFLSCPRNPGSKFYSLEKAISRGKLEELHGLALISKSETDMQAHWDQVMEFVLFRSNILSGSELKLSHSSICEALFYGFHILISRILSKSSNNVGGDSVFLLVLDTRFGGVLKLGGDLSNLELNPTNPYVSVAEWFKLHGEVSVSSVDRVWNKLGNANWGDIGTLQVILATFYSIVQWNGPPRRSIASLASDHSLRLQKRRIECRLNENENPLALFQQDTHHHHQQQQHGEIVELDQVDAYETSVRKKSSRLKLKHGEVVLLDDQNQGQRRFQIQEPLTRGNHFLYSAVSLDYESELLTLYVGAHPSRLEPSWEDMSRWYQVQRQTKVLNIFKHQGVSSKYLPEIIAAGRVLHSGACKKLSAKSRCDHPWCGTPLLVTTLVGEQVSTAIARNGPFSSDQALRCCRDCLSALKSAATTANVQHGDLCPENIIYVPDKLLYVPISWGHAVLEDRDSPAINLQFSSSHALQHGKLCPASDAESLIYILFYLCGGTLEQQDSIESALQWRERVWAKRLIQQHLGEVSALLKAFADYVDSLCGTPYPVDYEIWLKRLNKAVDGCSSTSSSRGKVIEEVATTLRSEDVAESSGTSGGVL